MCEPRRVRVKATRAVRRAWEREVERVAELVGTLTGEARIEQNLDASLGGQALMALQMALARGFDGWEADGDSYRHEVEGGYVVYHQDDHTLEIVATLSEELRAQGSARDRLSGTFEGELTAEAEGHYYNDGWGGRTRETAEKEAQSNLEERFEEGAQEAAEAEALRAEQEGSDDLELRAREAAQEDFDRRAGERRSELSRRAAEELTNVGARARRAFHQLLAHAYRDALLGLARRRGVDEGDVVLRDSEEYLELEFTLPG